mgnify:CR=1 FL=1
MFMERRGAAGSTSDLYMESVNPIKGSLCFYVQETLPSMLRTGWFQEWIRA